MGGTDDLEWDDAKEAVTLERRALSLMLAARAFDGRIRLDRRSAKGGAELRWETIAEIGGRVVFCVWTWRGARRRIISLRPASRSERRAYSEATRRS